MLVLTRNNRQGFVLEVEGREDIRIHIRILGIERDRVKIGIEAPPEVDIRRDELPKQ